MKFEIYVNGKLFRTVEGYINAWSVYRYALGFGAPAYLVDYATGEIIADSSEEDDG